MTSCLLFKDINPQMGNKLFPLIHLLIMGAKMKMADLQYVL